MIAAAQTTRPYVCYLGLTPLIPLLTGELKALAQPFYDHLRLRDPVWLDSEMIMANIRVVEPGSNPVSFSPYPWTSTAGDDANRAIACLGQLKALFSLHLETLADASPDSDGDGLSDRHELVLSTDPQKSDTDRDGVNDAQEIRLATNPLVADPWIDANGVPRDSDGDGLSDLFEVAYGTDPFDPDTNDNGMNDRIELDNGGDPRVPGGPPPIFPAIIADEAPDDPGIEAPPALQPATHQIFFESVSIDFAKQGHPTYQPLQPAKRYLRKDSRQSFRGGCPESGPNEINGSSSSTIDKITGDETLAGDSFVWTDGTPDSPIRASGEFQSSSYDDPPNTQPDCEGTVSHTSVLSSENTTAMMIASGIGEMDELQGGEELRTGTPFAYRNVHHNELRFEYQKCQFQFKWPTGTTAEQRHPLSYLLLFTPEDDPNTTENESANLEILRTIEWPGTAAESPLFVIDPETEKPGNDGVYSLLAVKVAVDADRDGEITFDGKDKTTAEKPFRFWINNDQDNVEVDEPVDVTLPDWSGGYILTRRDLEDFCRLRIVVGIANSQLRSGDLQVGVKFEGATSGGAYIRCWENQSLEGDSSYITDDAAADRQKLLIAFPRDSQTGVSIIPTGYWAKRTDSTAEIIFEGVEKGLGKLVVTIHDKNGLLLGEAGETWVQLFDVREMYQRARIVNEAEQIPDPWVNDNPPPQQWVWDPWNWPYSEDPDAESISAIFVHGWRMTYNEYLQWSQTTYKRLWHQGFKGKFYSFRWATHSPSLFTYNGSEYRAWLCGPALASFVNQLPNPLNRNLFAHSMGNVTSGAALRSGMAIRRYAMCNAAMAAMAYDPDPSLVPPDLAGINTPDTDSDPATATTYGLKNKFNLQNLPIINFALPRDSALDVWRTNNALFKPENLQNYYYDEFPLPMTSHKLFFNSPLVPNTFRGITSVPEAMGYVTKSRTRAVGAIVETHGAINDYHDMDAWSGEEHSAEWKWNIQSTYLFWEKLAEKLELNINTSGQ